MSNLYKTRKINDIAVVALKLVYYEQMLKAWLLGSTLKDRFPTNGNLITTSEPRLNKEEFNIRRCLKIMALEATDEIEIFYSP